MKRVRGAGSVYTPSEFLNVATRSSVDQALSRLVKSGKLRRLARRRYDSPKIHSRLGPLSPAPDHVAQALARETGSQVQIAGARAANALGLTTQVPAKSTYLTDEPSRRVALGKRVVDLPHASPKYLIAPGSPAGMVVQALHHVGQVRAADVAQVAAYRLLPSDKRALAISAYQAPAWMRPTLVSIATRERRASMDKVAKLDAKDRAALFGETGAMCGVAETIVEKDFWVCWTLRRLFSLTGKDAATLGPQALGKSCS